MLLIFVLGYSVNMISVIANQGKVRFKVFDGKMNADVLIDFCERLIKSAKRKVYLILDNLRVHHAKVFKAWIKGHCDHIEVFYLPSYSPELNPDEYLNCDLRRGITAGSLRETSRHNRKKLEDT